MTHFGRTILHLGAGNEGRLFSSGILYPPLQLISSATI